MERLKLWIYRDYSVEGNLEKDIVSWLQDFFDTDIFQRAAMLDIIRDLGIPFNQTYSYSLLDKDMIDAINNDSKELIELEIKQNGVYNLLISAEYLNKLYKGECTDAVLDFMDDLLLVFIVNTDFYVRYRKWVECIDVLLANKIKIIAVDVGDGLEAFKKLDLNSLVTDCAYNIVGTKVREIIGF